mmetsp:Transcript_129277/g.414423  ORF Transcript_129277/g.414423 Transcript_129277/m.414423 type:complete len:209 (-) Transcript_129277:190-816(-)
MCRDGAGQVAKASARRRGLREPHSGRHGSVAGAAALARGRARVRGRRGGALAARGDGAPRRQRAQLSLAAGLRECSRRSQGGRGQSGGSHPRGGGAARLAGVFGVAHRRRGVALGGAPAAEELPEGFRQGGLAARGPRRRLRGGRARRAPGAPPRGCRGPGASARGAEGAGAGRALGAAGEGRVPKAGRAPRLPRVRGYGAGTGGMDS